MLDQATLKLYIHYDPLTGIFTRIKTDKPNVRGLIGKPIQFKGTAARYVKLYLKGRSYVAHQLAWLYMTGEWPTHQIGYKNRNHADTRWSNLEPTCSITQLLNRPQIPANVRFWSKVDKKEPHECWEWQACHDRRGYGSFTSDKVSYIASRFCWYLTHGEHPPQDMEVCHSCDNPPRVNPSHLWLGTRQDNTDDCVRKGRTKARNPRQTHCKYGHPLTPDKVYLNRNGSRKCRECTLRRQRARRIRAKSQTVSKPLSLP